MANSILFKTDILKGPQGDRGEAGEAEAVPTDGVLAYYGDDVPEGYIETEEPEVLSDIVDQVSQNTSDIAVQTSRIDNIIALPSGSTQGDAELMDIRVGAYGTTYSTAGDAVRGQVDDIDNIFKYLGTYKNLCGEVGGTLYPCHIPTNTVITMSTGDGSNVWASDLVLNFYDSSKTLINGKTFVPNTNYRTVTVEFSDIAYIGWSRSYNHTLMVNIGKEKKPYIPFGENNLFTDPITNNIADAAEKYGVYKNLLGHDDRLYKLHLPKNTFITMSTSDGSAVNVNDLNLRFYNSQRQYIGAKTFTSGLSERSINVEFEDVTFIKWSRSYTVPIMVNLGIFKQPYKAYNEDAIIDDLTTQKLTGEKLYFTNYGLTQRGISASGADYDGDSTYKKNHYRTGYIDLAKDHIIVINNKNYDVKIALYNTIGHYNDPLFVGFDNLGTLENDPWIYRGLYASVLYVPAHPGYYMRFGFSSSCYSEFLASDITDNIDFYEVPIKPQPYELDKTMPYTYAGKMLDLKKHSFGLKKLFSSGAEPTSPWKSFQAFAISNGVLFQLMGDDYCYTYDMETGTKLNEFSITVGHGSSATFINTYESGNEYPYLYAGASKNNGYNYIYINRVTTSSATLVSALKINEDDCGIGGASFAIDKDNNVLWMACDKTGQQLDPTDNAIIISSYDLNNLTSNEDNTYTPALLSKEEIPFIKVIQSANFLNGCLYLLSAWSESTVDPDNAKLYVFDTFSHKIESVVDFPNSLKTCEFEDIEFLLDPIKDNYKMIGHCREDILDYFEINF